MKFRTSFFDFLKRQKVQENSKMGTRRAFYVALICESIREGAI